VELVHAALALPGGHGAAQAVGLAGVKPAASMAICITCSWKIGTPSVRPSASRSASLRVLHRLQPLAAAQVGVHHAALDGAGPHDGDLDHQVVEAAGRRRGSMLICARLSIWNTPTVSAAQIMS
jgi:hypothetical protein